MCSPGLEVEVELAATLALGRSVGDDHLDRLIVDLVGNPFGIPDSQPTAA